MHKKSLKRHERCKHGAREPYTAICCDSKEGIYMVKRSTHGGIGFPLHVQKIVNANKGNRMECENQSYRDLMIMAVRSEMTGRECVHLMQVNNAFFPVQVELDQRKLKELSETEKYEVLTEETVVDCIEKNSVATFYGSPTVVEWDDVNFIHLSIFDGKYMNFPVRSRYVVTYQNETGQLDCRCHPSKYFCIHKSIALWYLYQKDYLKDDNEQFTCVETNDSGFECPEPVLEGEKMKHSIVYPPLQENILVNMVHYFESHKKIPFSAPWQYQSMTKDTIPTVLKPTVSACHECSRPLAGPF